MTDDDKRIEIRTLLTNILTNWDTYENYGMIHDDLNKRYHAGLKEYGKPLRVLDGTDGLKEAREELLDFAYYITHARMEGHSVDSLNGLLDFITFLITAPFDQFVRYTLHPSAIVSLECGSDSDIDIDENGLVDEVDSLVITADTNTADEIDLVCTETYFSDDDDDDCASLDLGPVYMMNDNYDDDLPLPDYGLFRNVRDIDCIDDHVGRDKQPIGSMYPCISRWNTDRVWTDQFYQRQNSEQDDLYSVSTI